MNGISAERVFFWQRCESHLQAPFFEALYTSGAVNIHWVLELDRDPERLKQGWRFGVERPYVVQLSRQPEKALGLLSENEDAVHVFSGPVGERFRRRLFLLAASRRLRFGILSEPPFPGPLRNLGRLLLSRSVLRRAWPHVQLALGIGAGARRWFSSLGIPSDSIHAWAYCNTVQDWAWLGDGAKRFRIIYVGQFIRRKGLDLLFLALGEIRDLPWELVMLGGGSEESRLVSMSEHMGFAERVRWIPFSGQETVQKEIASSDLLVLPSRHDGWGSTVNEALMCGIPAMCSDRCGSAEVLIPEYGAWIGAPIHRTSSARVTKGGPQLGERGVVFRSGAVGDMARGLRMQIERGRPTLMAREALRAWALERLSGEALARYFIQLITWRGNKGSAPRPIAPWLS